MAPTATSEVAAQTGTVVFNSRSPNQVLTRRQPRHVDNGFGGKEVLTEDAFFQREEDAGKDFDRTPWKVEFVNHVLVIDESYKREKGLTDEEVAKLVAWLRAHPRLNVNEPSGFYEVGAAPDEPKPTMAEQMARISTASVQLDVDALQELIEAEKAEHNRLPILQAADAALLAIEGEDSGPGADAGTGNGDSPSTSPPSQHD